MPELYCGTATGYEPRGLIGRSGTPDQNHAILYGRVPPTLNLSGKCLERPSGDRREMIIAI
eukprot:2962062-Pleurochrysis_carterae.AAC.3